MGRKSYSKVGAVDNTPKQKDSNNPSVQSDVAVYDSGIHNLTTKGIEMVWQQWVYLVWMIFAVVLTIAQIGKPREPITPAVAVVVTVFSAGLIGLVLSI